MGRTTRACVLCCLAVLTLPGVAKGQASRFGPSFSLGGTTVPVDSPDVAHDSAHNLYLQVAGKVFIEAHLVNTAGAVVAAFRVNATPEYAQSPRVAFSPDIPGGGGYLVTWHSTMGAFTRVRGRIIRHDGVALTGDFDIAHSAVSQATGSNWTMGAAVEYATGSREFLVAWMGHYTNTNDIFFQRVSNEGGMLGGNTLLTAGTPDWERDPSVGYSPHSDEFFVAYAGYSESGRYGYAAGRRVKAGSGAVTSAQMQYGTAVATYVPAVTYNTSTQQYLLGWYNRQASSASVYGATLDLNGNMVGGVRVLSPFYSAYDALDIDYNPAAGQSLLVTHGGGASPWEDAAVSILSNGAPYDNGFILSKTTDLRALRPNPAANDGNYNPRLTSSVNEKKWLMVTSNVFSATLAQFASSDAVPTGGPQSPPVAASRPLLAVDSPAAGSTVSSTFAVAGWAVDAGAASGTGVSAIHVWAFPSTGASPIFVGAASLGVSRPDVGAHLGDSRFNVSGFGLSGSLPAGTYELRIFALSDVAGTFNNATVRTITVAAPASLPRMYVDAPAQNQTITQNVGVAGWAIDYAAASGTGIEAVHVWAYPVAGGAPVFVGVASLGYSRPDVAAAFGSEQFAPSGFYVSGTLPPGEYSLVAYAFSTITRTFNQAILVRVRVV